MNPRCGRNAPFFVSWRHRNYESSFAFPAPPREISFRARCPSRSLAVNHAAYEQRSAGNSEEPSMTLLTQTYALYVLISVAVTIWVARTLHRRGRAFLVNGVHGDELLADSINDLLVVGFYLLNFGYVSLALRYGQKPIDVQQAVEFLATKIGLVLLILAAMHFLNLLVFSKIGGRTKFKLKPLAESLQP